jgi:hypothetical protein
MIFSKATGYGIRALAYLASHSETGLCGLQEIAEHEHIPPVYLRKVLVSFAPSAVAFGKVPRRLRVGGADHHFVGSVSSVGAGSLSGWVHIGRPV